MFLGNSRLQLALVGAAIFFLGTWIVLCVVHVLALVYGKWRLYRRRTGAGPAGSASPAATDVVDLEVSLPGVSVIKPLCTGNDSNLFSNLETFFTMKYPKYELLFCIQDADDSRLRMYCESLRNKFPTVDCQIFYGGEQVGVNPKVNNMQPAYKVAKYDLLLVSDSGIRMREDTLADMVATMRDGVGLVHQMPFVCDRTGLPSSLEKVYFGTGHARMYLMANFFGVNCTTGMSALMRKTVLDEAGGLKAFGCYLAEDYFMAKAVLSKGLRIDISSQPALQNPGDNSVALFQARLMRWMKMRVAMLPHLMLFEPISECIVLGLGASWAVHYLFRWDPLSIFLMHVLAWFLSDWALIHVVQNGSLPFNKFEFMVMWFFRELSSPCLFVAAVLRPSIVWRTKEFRLKWGGVAEAVNRRAKL